MRNSSLAERPSRAAIWFWVRPGALSASSSRMSRPFSSAGALYWLASLLALRNVATPRQRALTLPGE